MEQGSTSLTKSKSTLRKIVSIITTLLLIISGVILAFVIMVMFVFNMDFTVMKDSSMEPAIHKDSLLIVQKTAANRVGDGEIIEYQLKSGEPGTSITRVLSSNPDNKGNVTFVAQKDNNLDEEQKVTDKQLKGKIYMLSKNTPFSIPFIGKLKTF